MTKKPFKSKKKKNFDPLNSFDNLSKKVKMLRREPSPVKEIMHFADPEYIKTLGINTDELISFAGGWVNHKAPEKLREAYESIVSDIDLFHSSGKYSSTLGEKEFKIAISLFEKELYKMDISEKQIAVGTGSTQLAMELFNVILDPGDKILLLDPSYCNYPTQLLTGIPDVEILRFSVMDEKEWKFIADEKIEEFCNYILDNKPKIVMLVSPDNPTSKILSDKFVKAALNATKEINGFLIIDFAYKELIFENNYPDYFSWSPSENYISLRTNSKWCRSLGRRVGWVEAPEFIIESMESIQTSTILCPDTLHQMALTRFIKESIKNKYLVDYIEETRKMYKNTAEKTVKLLKEKFDFKIIIPEGGLYIFMNVETDSAEFVEEVLKETGVSFVPGWGFGSTGKKAIRISFGPLVEDVQKIEKGLARVEKYLKNE